MSDLPDLRERVAAFGRWHYAIDLGAVTTPIFDPAHAIRHAERKKHFFDPVCHWLGGMHGLRVLDLGCNAGFWSLCAVDAGAAFVSGIDGRAVHIEQAELVFEARGVDRARYRFAQGNVLEANLGGPYDVVLCLGLLYHLDDPLGMLARIAALEPRVVILDSEVHPAPGVEPRRGTETASDPRSATASTSILVPTALALTEQMRAFGYDVALLRPRFSDWTGSADYRDGSRRALVCTRGLDLGTLAVERERPNALVRQVGRWLRWVTTRALWRLRRPS